MPEKHRAIVMYRDDVEKNVHYDKQLSHQFRIDVHTCGRESLVMSFVRIPPGHRSCAHYHEIQIKAFIPLIYKKRIEWCCVDAGDRNAGSIHVIRRTEKEKETRCYRIHVNRNHTSAVQFASRVHELGHLFLGHLEPDSALSVPQRQKMNHAQVELEAESVAFSYAQEMV